MHPTPTGKDHPRLRGEKGSGAGFQRRKRGSPPLTRGKERYKIQHRRTNGITPAYAGKSLQLATLPTGRKDHPRLRGEKDVCELLSEGERGSPPLTRGKARLERRRTSLSRITPAYAGKSGDVGVAHRVNGDHPRLRGEKLLNTGKMSQAQGSPPLTRGKVKSVFQTLLLNRITPAYAGKS